MGASADRPRLQVKRLRPDATVPRYMTEHAAGLDLTAVVDEPVVLAPGQRVAIPTGLVVVIPVGYEGQVRPRSGLALKHGLTVANAPGTIDADYRGELKVILVNLGHDSFTVSSGERVAQLVIAPVAQAEIEEVEEVDSTARGAGGFGSTGTGGTSP